MKKRLLTIIISLALVLSVMPITAVAADKTLTSTLDLSEQGDTGSEAAGYVWDSASKTLTLYGLTVSVDGNNGILLPGGSAIVLNGSNSITVANGVNDYCGIWCLGDLTVSGSGSLNFSGPDACGIFAMGALFTLKSGSLTMKCNFAVSAQSVSIEGGSLTAACTGTGIFARSGRIDISGGSIDLTASTGIRADHLEISGGNTVIDSDNTGLFIGTQDTFIMTGGLLDVTGGEQAVFVAGGLDSINTGNLTVQVNADSDNNTLAPGAKGLLIGGYNSSFALVNDIDGDGIITGNPATRVVIKKTGNGNWEDEEATITLISHDGGSTDPAGPAKVDDGDSFTFKVIPDKGYTVEKVLVNGKDVGAVTEYTIAGVRGDYVVEAYFTAAKVNPGTGRY